VSIHGLITLKTKAVHSFETSGCNYSTTWCKNTEELISEYKNRFVANKIFQFCIFSCGEVASFPLDLAISFTVVFFLSVLVVAQATRSIGVIIITILTSNSGSEQQSYLMCSVMLKMLNVRLTCHREPASYGTFLDSPVTCIHSCSWSGQFTRVKMTFLFPPPPPSIYPLFPP
jgi:hypothetical protein